MIIITDVSLSLFSLSEINTSILKKNTKLRCEKRVKVLSSLKKQRLCSVRHKAHGSGQVRSWVMALRPFSPSQAPFVPRPTAFSGVFTGWVCP